MKKVALLLSGFYENRHVDGNAEFNNIIRYVTHFILYYNSGITIVEQGRRALEDAINSKNSWMLNPQVIETSQGKTGLFTKMTLSVTRKPSKHAPHTNPPLPYTITLEDFQQKKWVLSDAGERSVGYERALNFLEEVRTHVVHAAADKDMEHLPGTVGWTNKMRRYDDKEHATSLLFYTLDNYHIREKKGSWSRFPPIPQTGDQSHHALFTIALRELLKFDDIILVGEFSNYVLPLVQMMIEYDKTGKSSQKLVPKIVIFHDCVISLSGSKVETSEKLAELEKCGITTFSSPRDYVDKRGPLRPPTHPNPSSHTKTQYLAICDGKI